MRPSREEIVDYLKALQSEIISAFETFEKQARFQKKSWDYSSGGGGVIGAIRGDVFEKAAVNFSAVEGPKLPLSQKPIPFFATGVSLITHMKNPHAPTVHMNVRYIETKERYWFGGGYDLTPMGQFYPEDKEHFHKTAQSELSQIDPSLYPTFSKQARDYFYIPHRKKERGVGGIFFDQYNSGDLDHNLKVFNATAKSFLPAIIPIYQKRVSLEYTEEDKKLQEELRAHYVEFNLIYDRGTRFGFESNGNPEAILSSMPPRARW